MKQRKPTISATFSQKQEMYNTLTERLHSVEDTDLVRYEEGWHDERIAKEVDPKFSESIAARIRMECFGKLQGKIYKGRLNNPAHEERISKLENQFRRYLKWQGLKTKDLAYIFNEEDSTS